ncbi:MAG: protoporphyrinogen oxidase-like protein [Candidatus Omnitrophica bacterium]|nr:protoporphyrinogen oxidase-like protein [Candidatus Omnitrophota bacterium]
MSDLFQDLHSNGMIIGGGVTGLGAGCVSGVPVWEALEQAGGICSSYYIRHRGSVRLRECPEDGEVYRFEKGGGHWIFGQDPFVFRWIRQFVPVKSYKRRSSVYFSKDQRYVPFPLQNNLRYLPSGLARRALREMEKSRKTYRTMREWLEVTFGPTLCKLFFYPFHSLYTAGLDDKIAPQDAYKSPVHMESVRRGARCETETAGYNISYVYPECGLDTLVERMADLCDLRLGFEVSSIDVVRREVHFSSGDSAPYNKILCTLPLNRTVALAGLTMDEEADPYTSVLVLNIGALRGPACPEDHWLYVPDSQSGFHRVGFYSNVDKSFLPKSLQDSGSHVSLYVERAYAMAVKPNTEEILAYSQSVIQELQSWGFIGEVEVLDPTWIDTAYTWSYPGSCWRGKAIRLLERYDIDCAGRYGRWTFQGIADSIRDGFLAGSCLKVSGDEKCYAEGSLFAATRLGWKK